jgi:glycosyltransferase involved in cell wall biosynthesis
MFYKFLGWLEQKIYTWQFTVVGSPVMFEEIKAMKVTDMNKVADIGYSVNMDRFSPRDFPEELGRKLGIEYSPATILYMGLLEGYQGVNIMFDAFRIIFKKNPRVRFIVIGYPNIDYYRDISKNYGTSDNTYFLGKIDYNDVPLYLSLSKIAVAPKVSVTEGDGKLYDYMAMGMAIVAFDRDVSRSIMEECGIYADFANAESLAEKLLWFIENPQEAQKYGMMARARAIEKYSIPSFVSRLEQVYENL